MLFYYRRFCSLLSVVVSAAATTASAAATPCGASPTTHGSPHFATHTLTRDTSQHPLQAIYKIAHQTWLAATNSRPTPPHLPSDRAFIAQYVRTMGEQMLLVANTPAPPSNQPDYKTIDEVLYIDNQIATRYQATRYLESHPAVVLNMDLHPDLPTQEVFEQLLYINGDLASRQQANTYQQSHPNVTLDLAMHPEIMTEATAPKFKIVDQMLYIEGRLSSLAEASAFLKQDPAARIDLQKYTQAVGSSNLAAATNEQTATSAASNTSSLKKVGYEILEKVLYLNGEIASRQQAQKYVALNPKVKGKINLQLQPDWDTTATDENDSDAPATATTATAAAITTKASSNDKLAASTAPLSKAIKGKGYEIFERVLYIEGEIASLQQAQKYVALNPKMKSKVNLQMQPDWDTSSDEAKDNSNASVAATPDDDAIESEEYEVIENVLYINGDIATRAEANSYIAKNPKQSKQINIKLQPEYIDDYDPSSTLSQLVKPSAILNNPEIIDGKLYINGKPASAKEKSAYEAATGVLIKYDKMIGEYEKSAFGKAAWNNTPLPTSQFNQSPLPVGGKVLLSKNYDEAIPCFAHYDGNWDNDNIFPYRYDLTQMPQQVEFLLTHGLEGDFAMPSLGDITSGFGRRWGRHHNGIDIDLETGDEVRTAFEGKVRCAQYSSSYGYLVVIRHYNGLETFYAHLSSLLVRPNDIVTAGTVIGLGGTTGRSTGSHLHFEVRYKGHPFNPALLIDFGNKQLRANSFTVDRHFFSSDNPYVIDDGSSAHRSHSAASSRKTTKSSKYYTVRKGDTLDEIASRNRTSVRKLCALNRMSSRTILSIGRKLRVK